MPGSNLSEQKLRDTIAFHGHWCPGLATGIRVAEAAVEKIGKATDEEIVAVAECDSCAVDAVQFLTGCTVGKGNLIVDNVGKMAFSFYRRRDGESFRIVRKVDPAKESDGEYRFLQERRNSGDITDEEAARLEAIRMEQCKRLMECPLDELFAVGKPLKPAPAFAPMKRSLLCEVCGEMVMETRARLSDGRVLCPHCFAAEVHRP